MPSNPNKEDRLCRQWLHNLLTKCPAEGLVIRSLERQALLSFAVSAGMVKRFVREYYLEAGLIEERDGVFYPATTEV